MNNSKNSRVEALVSGHPWDAKKVSITEAGHIQKCKNTEFLWEFRKMGIYEGGHMYGCPLAKVPVRRVSTVFYSKQNQITEEICNRLYD